MLGKLLDFTTKLFKLQFGATTQSERMLWLTQGIILLAYLALTWHPEPIIRGDAPSYIDFSPYRTAGYPILIWIFGVKGLALLQPILYGLASLFAGRELGRFLRLPLIAIPIQAALLCNPDLNYYHAVIMTESLFATMLLLLFICFLSLARAPSLPRLAALAVTAAVMAAIRPTAFAYFPVVLLLAFACRREPGFRWRTGIVLVIALIATITLAERTFTHWYHGDAATSLAGRHLYAKAAMIEAPKMKDDGHDPIRTFLIDALEEHYAPIRDLIAQSPNENVRQFMTLYYEQCVEYTCGAYARDSVNLPKPELFAAMQKVALERLSSAPMEYIALTWLHYRSLWHIYAHNHPDLLAELKAFADPRRPLPFEAMNWEAQLQFQPKTIARVARPIVLVIGIITGLIALAGIPLLLLGRIRSPWALAGATALALHGALLFTSIFGLGIARYTMSQWPAMVPPLAIAAVEILRWIRSRRLGQKQNAETV